MRQSVGYSFLLHVSVATVAYFGLPHISRAPLPVEAPVMVEIVTVAEETNVPPPEPETKPEPKKVEPPPPPPEPPKVAAAKPPPPAPPPEPEPEPEVAAVPPPQTPKPKPKPKPEAKPKPKPKAPGRLVRAQPKRKPKPPDALVSVLKTVEDLKEQPRQPKEKEKEKKKEEKKEESLSTQIAKALKAPARHYDAALPMTISEIDLVRQQIARCWNLPAGAREAENLVIEIWVAMNPDGTVREARIRDTARMTSDLFFRAAAESALRAILNPRCNPLRLPREKYEHWKTMTLNFNPREMFGS